MTNNDRRQPGGNRTNPDHPHYDPVSQARGDLDTHLATLDADGVPLYPDLTDDETTKLAELRTVLSFNLADLATLIAGLCSFSEFDVADLTERLAMAERHLIRRASNA